MKTSKGIYLDLSESDYIFKYEGIEYYFSSVLYMEKFKKLVDSYVTEETAKLEIKYKLFIDFRVYLAISLYKRIEKRGFRIVVDDVVLNENIWIENNISSSGEIFLLRK